MNSYIAGDMIVLTSAFVDASNNPIDPTTVQVSYDASNTTPVTVTYAGSSTPGAGYVFRTTTGGYTFWLDTTSLLGYLIYEWTGLGAGQTIGTSSALINPRSI